MRWMWIDRIVHLEAGVRIVAIKNVSMAEDHLHDHFAADHRAQVPVMPAALIVEGMAQTAGILVGHAEAFKHKVVLAKVAVAQLTHDVTPGMTIRYSAHIDRRDDIGASTIGVVEVLDPSRPEAGYTAIGRIELLFSHLDNNMAGQEYPEENFVFGESFKMLLRTSGIE